MHVGLDVPRIGVDHTRCGAGLREAGAAQLRVVLSWSAHLRAPRQGARTGQAAAAVWLVHVVCDPLYLARGLGHAWGLGALSPILAEQMAPERDVN